MSRRTGILLAFIGTILGGLLGPLAYYNHWPAIPVYLAAQPASFVASLLLNRSLPRFTRWNVAGGIAVAFVSILYYLSMEYGAVGTATLFGHTSIVWSQILLVARGNARYTRAFWMNTIAVLLGVAVILGGGLSGSQTTGALFALANGFFYGLWSFFRNEVIRSETDEASHELAIGRIHALPLAFFYFLQPQNRPLLADYSSFGIALFTGAVAAANFTCLSQAYRAPQLTPAQILTINTLRVPIATFVAVYWLNDALNFATVLGTALVLVGIYGSIRERHGVLFPMLPQPR